jgi:pimeloyl-ACP methyl ester carboxylesterase
MTTRAQFCRRLAVAIVCAGLAPEQPVLGQTGQDKFFESNGIRIRYQITGEGVPVILLHGLGGTLESWQRVGVTGMLARHFRVVAMDMRGHGQSGKPHDPKFYGPALAADIVRLLNHIGAAKAHVVGYSLGGLIALDFAALQQKHAASVLIGGTGWPPPDALNNFRKTAEGFEQGKFRVREGDDAMAWGALSRGLRILTADEVHRIKIPMAIVTVLMTHSCPTHSGLLARFLRRKSS